MATFTYTPDWNASKKMKPRVNKLQFGDGYEVRQADGLNTKLEAWDLMFKRNTVDAEAIDAFLTARGGVESFNWTNPNGVASVYVCDEWTTTYNDVGWSTVSATFREVPEVASA